MSGTQDIRRRIKSIKSTRQITKAMQLVASSKMRKAQEAATNSIPFGQLLLNILVDLSGICAEYENPFLAPREVKTRGIILVTTNKGLCGGLNSNLFRLVEQRVKGPAKFVAVGRKGAQYVARTGRKLHATFFVDDKAPVSQTQPISQLMTEMYLKQEIDSIEIAYPFFRNTLVQTPTILPLLPLGDLHAFLKRVREQMGQAAHASDISTDTRPMQFEPSPEAILDSLLPFYINREIRNTIIIAKASEHSARMVAMKSATDNANQLIDHLTLQYNKARQTAITNEIVELSASQLAQS